jgi:hypothetical protein
MRLFIRMMIFRKILTIGVSGLGMLFAAACAQPSLPAPESLTSPLVGRLTSGSVLTIRAVAIPINDPSFELVLTVFREPPMANPPGAVEILVRRQNGAVSSMIEPSAEPARFQPGQSVSIVEAAQTVLQPH